MIRSIASYDNIGIISSSLCILHCIGTPFIFIVKACSTACCADTPVWWQMIDYLFLVICFFAIYHSTKNTNTDWLKFSFWTAWAILFILLINHTYSFLAMNPIILYIPSIAIIILHFYNIRYCREEENCCETLLK